MKRIMAVLPTASVTVALLLTTIAWQNNANVFRWSEGAPNSERLFRDGKVIKIVTGNGFTVEANIQDTGWKMRADILIKNDSTERVDIRPETFTLTVVQPRVKPLAYQDPEKLVSSIQRNAALSATLKQIGAGMQTTRSTTLSSSGRIHTTTQPDYEAKRRAKEEATRTVADAEQAAEHIRSITFKPHTLLPGEEKAGAVYFEREGKCKETILRVPVGWSVFEFSFRWDRK